VSKAVSFDATQSSSSSSSSSAVFQLDDVQANLLAIAIPHLRWQTILTEDEERRRRRGRLAGTPYLLGTVIEEIELGLWFFLSLGATTENLGFGQSWFTLGVQF
jgi:hypothetical protein